MLQQLSTSILNAHFISILPESFVLAYHTQLSNFVVVVPAKIPETLKIVLQILPSII